MKKRQTRQLAKTRAVTKEVQDADVYSNNLSFSSTPSHPHPPWRFPCEGPGVIKVSFVGAALLRSSGMGLMGI